VAPVVLLRSALGLVTLVALLAVAAATGTGLKTGLPLILDRALPEGWSMTVSDVDGSWLSHFDIVGLEVRGPGVTASVDRLDLAFRATALLGRAVEIENLRLERPHLRSTRVATGDSDTLRPGAPPPDAPEPDSAPSALGRLLSGRPVSTWPVRVRSFRIVEGFAEMRASSDTYSISNLAVSARASLDDDGLALAVDTLRGDFLSVRAPTPRRGARRSAPESAFRSSGSLALSGALRRGELRLDTLHVASDVSTVSGGGRLAFAAPSAAIDDFTLTLDAAPLDLRDLPIALPAAVIERSLVRGSIVGTGRPDSLRLELRADALGGGTRLRGDAVVRASGARPAATGRVELRGLDLSLTPSGPFDGTAAAELAFTLERFEAPSDFSIAGTVTHDAPARPLRARLDVRGTTPSPGDTAEPRSPLRVDAEVDLDTGPDRRSFGRATARLRGATAEWSVDLRVDSGTVRGDGQAEWGGTTPVFEVRALELGSLDAHAVDPTYPPTRLSGRISGRLSGSTAASMSGRTEAELRGSSIGGTAIDTLNVRASLDHGTASGTLLVRGAQGAADLEYTAEMADGAIRFELPRFVATRPHPDDASSELMDAAPELMDGATAPSAVAAGAVSGSWALDGPRRGEAHVALDSVRWGSTRAGRGRVTARVSGDRVVADASLDSVSALPGRTRLRASADLTGTALDGIEGSVRADVSRAHEGSAGSSDSVRVDLTIDGDGRFDVGGWLRPAERGEIAFRGSALLREDSLTFELEGGGGIGGPVDVLAGASIDSMAFVTSGRRSAAVWESLSADVALAEMRWREVEARSARARLVSDSLGIRLDTLEIVSNVLVAGGTGSLPRDGRAGRLDLNASLLTLDPLRGLLGREVLEVGGGTLAVFLTGSLDSLAWSSEVDVQAMVADGIRIDGLRITGEGSSVPPRAELLGLTASRVDVTLDRVLLPESQVQSVTLAIDGGRDSIRVEAAAVVDDRRRASLRAHVDPHPERKRARIEEISLSIDEDRWTLSEPAFVTYRDGVFFEPVTVTAGDQEIRFQGGVTADGLLDLNARVDSTDVSMVADLIGLPRLRGWLSGRLRVQGPTAAPEAWLDVDGFLHTAARTPVPVDARLRANGRSVRGDLRLQGTGDGSFRIRGGALLPGARSATGEAAFRPRPDAADALFGFASDSIGLTVAADSFRVGWVEAFLGEATVGSIGGVLHGELTMSGSAWAPRVGGALRIRDGAVEPVGLGVAWQRMGLVVRGEGDELVVDSARVTSGSGTLRARGRIGVLGAMPLDLRVDLDDFRAIRTDAYRATLSGDVTVGGTIPFPTLDGRLRVEALDVYLDERVTGDGLESVELTEEDLRMLRQRFGIVPERETRRRPFSERLTAALEIELGRDSWLRKRTSPEMAVPFGGTIEVVLEPGAGPSIQGSVDVIEGRGFVEQFGRRFTLSEGTVTFNGPPSEASLDLQATYSVPSHDSPDGDEVTIVLRVLGTQESLGLELSSEPQMENADIVSYIATGRPAAGSLSFQDGGSESGLVTAGAGLALGQMTSLVEGAAARSVGLDVVEIRREGLRQATLVAGKYVSPRLYVGFAQPVSLQEGSSRSTGSGTGSEIEIELEALRWLIVNIEGSGSDLRLFLRGRYAY